MGICFDTLFLTIAKIAVEKRREPRMNLIFDSWKGFMMCQMQVRKRSLQISSKKLVNCVNNKSRTTIAKS